MAEQGSATAENNLGLMYRNGQGVEQSDEQEVAWYRKAAEQGHADAQHNLAVMSKRRTESTVSEQVIGCAVLAVCVAIAIWILSLLWKLGAWFLSLF